MCCLWYCVQIRKPLFNLKFGWNVPGAGGRELADTRYPPFWDLEFGERFKELNLADLDLDSEQFGNYVAIKVEDMILEVRHYCSQWNNRTVSHCVNLCEMIGDYTISIVLFLTLIGSRYFSTDFGYRGVKKCPHYISSTIGTTIQYIQLYNCIQLYTTIYNHIQLYTTIL